MFMKKNNFKMLLILAVVVIMANAAACNDLTKNNGTVKTIEGFDVYENNTIGIKIQYPAEWMYIDSSLNKDDINAAILEVFGQEKADLFNELETDLSSISVVWYDFENSGDMFVPNANLVVSDAGGATQNDLKSPSYQKDIQDSFEGYYKQIFGNFKTVGDIKGRTLGSNYFINYTFNYTLDSESGELNLICCQEITEKNGNLYIFTFTTQAGKMNNATYEKMLSTLEF